MDIKDSFRPQKQQLYICLDSEIHRRLSKSDIVQPCRQMRQQLGETHRKCTSLLGKPIGFLLQAYLQCDGHLTCKR
jgi:hypothetical protein